MKLLTGNRRLERMFHKRPTVQDANLASLARGPSIYVKLADKREWNKSCKWKREMGMITQIVAKRY